MTTFEKERNEALFSLNRKKIEVYLRKRGKTIPENDTVFWASVYKCICNIAEAPTELKEQASFWLRCHGMSSRIAFPCTYTSKYDMQTDRLR